MARDNDVIIFTLVPHTTHEMQPLDTAVFGPFIKPGGKRLVIATSKQILEGSLPSTLSMQYFLKLG